MKKTKIIANLLIISMIISIFSDISIYAKDINNKSKSNIQTSDGFDVDERGVVLVNEKNTAEALMKNTNYEDIFIDNIFGIAGNFFLTGFESVEINAHTAGNVLTRKLTNNNNFGSNHFREISYVIDEIKIENPDIIGKENSMFVFGNNIDIKKSTNNKWVIGQKEINKPNNSDNNGENIYLVWQDTDTKFIDFDKMQEDMMDLSREFSSMEQNKGYEIITEQNEMNRIGMNGVKKALVLPKDYSDMYVYNLDLDTIIDLNTTENGKLGIGIGTLTKEKQTVVLNIDAKGEKNIKLPSIKYKYNKDFIDNTEFKEASNGNIIVNIYDSTKSDRMFTGDVITGNKNNIFLLAPKGDVKISEQFNGIIIANNIVGSKTEIHRDIPTTPPLPEEEKINLSVEKQWIAANGDEEGREVKVILYADGVEYKELTITGPDWKGEFRNLPKYKKGTKDLIKYTIKEIEIEGYTSDIEDSELGFIIKNTKTEKPEEFTMLSVEKIWQDENGKEIDKIYDKNGKEIKEIAVDIINSETGKIIQNIILKASEDWKFEIKNLPKVDKETGKLIKYYLKEVSKIEGFNLNKIVDNSKQGENYDFDVINSRTFPVDEKINIPVEKTWKVKNESIIKDKIVEVKLLENGQFKEKTIKLSKDNNWKASFENLPKKDDTWKDIVYTIDEVNIAGFDKEIKGNQEDGFNIVNTEITIDIPVEKTWKVKDESTIKDLVVEVKLLENGKFQGKTLKLTNENGWIGSFKNLPTKTSDGKDIVYDVEEINIPGFDKGKGGNQYTGFKIINAERPIDPPIEIKIDIPVEKYWEVEDESTINNLKVSIRLLENGEYKGNKLTLTKDNNWKGIFKDLPEKTIDGEDIVYTIDEVNIPGFSKEIKGNQDDGFKVSNKEVKKEFIEIKVEKNG